MGEQLGLTGEQVSLWYVGRQQAAMCSAAVASAATAQLRQVHERAMQRQLQHPQHQGWAQQHHYQGWEQVPAPSAQWDGEAEEGGGEGD
jgi:hypothetical protein